MIWGWKKPLSDDVPLVIEPAKDYLNRRQLEELATIPESPEDDTKENPLPIETGYRKF